MKHPLRVNQVFKCPRFENLCGTLELGVDGAKPHVNWDRLRLADLTTNTTAYWTEYRDGWEKKHELVFDLRVQKSLADTEFLVTRVALTGGGAGHGLHDVFPDGHRVWAKEVIDLSDSEFTTGKRTVNFYQSGCFSVLVKPKEVILVRGSQDVKCEWTQVYVEYYEPRRDNEGTTEACRYCGLEWRCPDCDGRGIERG